MYLNGGDANDCWNAHETPLIVESKVKSDCLETAGDELLSLSSLLPIEFPNDVVPPAVQSKIFLLMSPINKDPIITLLPLGRESRGIGFLNPLLLSKGNNSVSVSKSANERSSNVLFIAMLLAVGAVETMVGLLTIASLWMLPVVLFIVFIVEENVFSNLMIGFVVVTSSCDVVKIGCDIMGDEEEELMLIDDGNDEEDDIPDDALEVATRLC